jgi:hypothetical protein
MVLGIFFHGLETTIAKIDSKTEEIDYLLEVPEYDELI